MTDTNPPQDETPEREPPLPLSIQVALEVRRFEFLWMIDNMLADDDQARGERWLRK